METDKASATRDQNSPPFLNFFPTDSNFTYNELLK